MDRKIEIPNAVLFEQVKQLLREGHNVVLRGKGQSMLPFIRDGVDSVVLEKADEDLRIGDIVLAQLGDGCYVLHRIIELCGEEVILMGDGNLVGIEKCQRSSIIAYVEKIIKPSGERVCRMKSERLRWMIWHRLRFLRRYFLAFYRRVIL